MRLYLDLAMRLLWGSRLNASTRMTALLALGILVSTAFGVIVVGLVNKGFSAILQAETSRLRDTPKFTVNLSVSVPPQNPGFARAMEKRAQAQEAFSRAWGQDLPPEWNYRFINMLFVPEENLSELLRLQKQVKQQSPEEPGKDATREQQVAYQAKVAKLNDLRMEMFERLHLSFGAACAAPGVGPSRMSETWVLRTWGEFGQAPGSGWVGLLPGPTPGSSPLLHKNLAVARLATRQMRATGCEYWISPTLMDIIERRYPEHVVLSMRSNRPAPEALLDTWFDNTFSHASGPKGKPYLEGQYDFPRTGDSGAQNLTAAEKVLSVQRLVSWLVVGMMGALSIYQVCSLMMMLGLHFRFDVAMLRSLGMSRLRVMMVFVVSSIVIMAVGLGVGMLAAWWWLPHMNTHLEWLLLALDAPDLVDWVPWIHDRAFAWSAFGAGMGLGLLAALIPAWTASRALPSDIWREET